MKKNATPTLRLVAVAHEYSLRTDGQWLTIGGDKVDVIRTGSMNEVAAWMRARAALKFGYVLFADDEEIMRKSPGSHAIELVEAEEAVAA